MVALVVAGLLAYANSLSGPFVFDDRPAILANPSLEHLATALSPPRDGGTVAGRPLVNLSLALNRRLGGTEVTGYHVFNLLIHLAAGLALFGVIRRTAVAVSAPRCEGRSLATGGATSLAFTATLLWIVHPLCTAAVTYTVQRAEAMMALCLLLTLYGFARAAGCRGTADTEIRHRRMWYTVSAAACLAGMACKETMAAAPIVILLYDRTFFAGSCGRAWRERKGYYSALAASWLLLAWLVGANASRAGTVGFGGRIGWTDYAVTQLDAVAQYAKLAVWPSPLIFDYGTATYSRLIEVGPQAVFVLLVVAACLAGACRRTAAGLAGITALLVLAPSSSVVPIQTQTVAEHRMYLPLAAACVVLALVLRARLPRSALAVSVVLALPLACATHLRNRDYVTDVALWSDTVRKRPDNARAHNHLANALVQAGRVPEAITHYLRALALEPGAAEVHSNLGSALTAAGRAGEALPHLEAAVRLNPASGAAHLNLANALTRADRPTDAVSHFAEAERTLTLDAAAHYNFGVALARTRQLAPAIEHFRATLRADPSHVGARVNLANALLVTGRTAEAIVEYETALALRPGDPQITANLALARRQRPSPRQ